MVTLVALGLGFSVNQLGPFLEKPPIDCWHLKFPPSVSRPLDLNFEQCSNPTPFALNPKP